MFKQCPLCLITNDDGIYAEGIAVVADALKYLAEVIIVAPENNQSGVSHRITLKESILVKKVKERISGVQSYIVAGTPSDCVRIGVFGLARSPISLVISGVNQGANMGEDVVYSGTVAAAREGAMLGIPSMAVSVADGACTSIPQVQQIIRESAVWILHNKKYSRSFFNINIPERIPDNKVRYKLTRLGKRNYSTRYVKKASLCQQWVYKLQEKVSGIPARGSDIGEVEHGFVSITPMTLNFTDEAVLKKYKIKNINL
ncbi:MAG: 5'/3'-nucleotidase SurE [bacterium]